MTGIDKVILCDNKAKNVAIAIVTARLFNEVSVQKNKLKRSGYFITIPYLLFVLQFIAIIILWRMLTRFF